ncbi:MAG: hypothetical protein K2X87_03220 [Gemmataceae bacterium]|nr:hypothetical protein [Gemmataceae bacterium]
MSRDFKVAVVVLLAAAAAFTLVAGRDIRGAARQRANLAVAEEEMPRVRAALEADPRFQNVRAELYTPQGGGLGLWGAVETDDDLFRLMKAIAGLRLRVPVAWEVKVRPAPP